MLKIFNINKGKRIVLNFFFTFFSTSTILPDQHKIGPLELSFPTFTVVIAAWELFNLLQYVLHLLVFRIKNWQRWNGSLLVGHLELSPEYHCFCSPPLFGVFILFVLSCCSLMEWLELYGTKKSWNVENRYPGNTYLKPKSREQDKNTVIIYVSLINVSKRRQSLWQLTGEMALSAGSLN